MSPRNGVRTGTSPWTTDHTGDAPALPVLSPRLEWTSAALRRRRLPVRIRPGTLRARSSTSALAQASFARRSRRGRAGEPSKGSRLDVRRSRKAEIRGASPLGSTAPRSNWTDTRVLSETVWVRIPPGPRHFWRRYVGIPRSFVEPRTDGYRQDLTVIGVRIPGVSSDSGA